jgi:hypothetical protein
MNRNLFVALGLAVLVTPVAAAADAGRMSAAQIVDRNVAARGGLAAWRAVNTLTMSGELDAGGGEGDEATVRGHHEAPPHKVRFELRFQDQTAVQVYDGTQGWKVRPFWGGTAPSRSRPPRQRQRPNGLSSTDRWSITPGRGLPSNLKALTPWKAIVPTGSG